MLLSFWVVSDKDQSHPSVLAPFSLKAAQSSPMSISPCCFRANCTDGVTASILALFCSIQPLPPLTSFTSKVHSYLLAAHSYYHICHIAHKLLHHPSLPSHSCNSPAPNPCVFFVFTPSFQSRLNMQTPSLVVSQPRCFLESLKRVHCLHLPCSISQASCLYLSESYIANMCRVLIPGTRKPCYRAIRAGKKRSLDKRLNSQCH